MASRTDPSPGRPPERPGGLPLCTREMLHEIESRALAPFACHSAAGRGREHPEDEAPYRTAFQRDRDRIVHCAAFRRLEYKTQVFINTEGDHYRTRLTHSLEVSQIARSLARMLRLNEDLVEAIALAHDLGHTPFGHAGERALDRLMSAHGGFEHNAQAVRVVELLERRTDRYPGLNLTEETREGIRKHFTWYDNPQGHLWDDAEGLRFPHLEAQVVDAADEIAYNNHDVDDGLFARLLVLDDVLDHLPLWREVFEAQAATAPDASRRDLLRRTVSAMINLQVTDVARHSLARIERCGIACPEDARRSAERIVGFSPEMDRHNEHTKKYLYATLYRHHRVMGEMDKCERMMAELFDLLVSKPMLLRPQFRARIDRPDPIHRVVADYIAGMTDRYALEEYQRLFIPDISLHSRR